MLGASFDTPAENAAFAEKFGYPFPLLCDTTRELGLAYGACDDSGAAHARRITYVIDANGLIEQAIETKQPAEQAASLLATN